MTTRMWLKSVLIPLAVASVAAGCSKGSDPTPTPPTTKSVAVTGATTVGVGSSTQLTATATMSDNSVQTVTSSSTWATSSAGVASVSGGLVQGLSAGDTNISATSQGVTSPAFTVTVQGIVAAFTATPDAGLGFNAGQCPLNAAVNVGGQTVNQFLCTLDATSSTSPAGTTISSYTWEIPEGGKTFTGSKVNSGFTIACGSFGGGGTRRVKLTIVTSAGSNSVSNNVTFVKSTPC